MSATLSIASRLQMLESILGQAVFLADEEEEPEYLPRDKVARRMVVQKEEKRKSCSSTEASSVVRATMTEAAPPASSEDVCENEFVVEMARFRDLKPQDLSDEDLRFCPWKLVKSYADAYTGKGNRERVRPFFDNALNSQDWYFFYIRDTRDSKKAHLLVPTGGVEHLLRYINNRLGTALSIPHGAARRGFNLRFSGCGTSRPRFLMHHHPRRGAGDVVAAAVEDSGFDIEDPSTWPRDDGADSGSLAGEAGARLQANMVLMRRDPAEGSSKISAAERAEKRKERRRKEMKAMCGYLGLKNGIVEDGSSSDAVFFCVDVEAIEVSPGPVSEIGIAILDMQRVGEQSPGNRGRDWWPLIEAHHLRIKEYAGLTNYRYVRGCPDDFQFGQSTFPSRSEAGEAVRAILRPYVDAKRRIVLAGHDVEHDVNYLRDGVGVDVRHEYRDELVGTVDSQTLFQAWMATDTGRSLGVALDELGFEYAYLHNAGNDAMHTLRAAIGAAFADAEPADSPA